MQPFTLQNRLDGASAIMLASPHSGSFLPPVIRENLRAPMAILRRMEDAHMGQLLHPAAQKHGLPLIEATHSRAFFDLNRAEAELDPAMFRGALEIETRLTEKVRRGHGLIPRIVSAGQQIHKDRLPASLAHEWITTLHRPWHEAISTGLAAARARHGHALLLDMHSMPTLSGQAPAQVVLGDRHGKSAAPDIVDWLEARFTAHGLKVARNDPYAGGHTTERHGNPAVNIHAVQIELDRSLYMSPDDLKPHPGFQPLSALLCEIFGKLQIALPTLVRDRNSMAAE